MVCVCAHMCLCVSKVEINVGSGVCQMRQNPSERSHVATGGKENPLKVWDLQRPDTPVFTAKNVRDMYTHSDCMHHFHVCVIIIIVNYHMSCNHKLFA